MKPAVGPGERHAVQLDDYNGGTRDRMAIRVHHPTRQRVICEQ